MSVVLGANQYGKAEVRLVHVERTGDRHEITDLNVSSALSGELTETHLTGDNSAVLPTDTQKNTVFALARDGVGQIEGFALRLARHFVDSQPTIGLARVAITQAPWERIGPHSFASGGGGVRTTRVTYDGDQAWVLSGLTGLTLLNSTASEFWGYVKDRYTTLAETHDRILATAVDATWRHAAADHDEAYWSASYQAARSALIAAFADTHSLSLQQTLYAMGERVLAACPGVVEIRLSLPNKHHFLVDLAPFGIDNPGEVFYAADRPYGLIEGTVLRDDAPDAGPAW
jgi:urate oxidase